MCNRYKHLIHPDFRKIAWKAPFGIMTIRVAAILQPLVPKAVPMPKGISKRTFSISGYNGQKVPIEVFEPEHANGILPCILYIHGGGFGYKAAPHHRKFACIYAKMANCRVFFPEYHLLPKYVFPAAYIDVLSVYEWMCNHSKKLLIDEKHIAVVGDSSGAILAANLCNVVEKHNYTIPCFQMLIYPATDAQTLTESMIKYSDAPIWSLANNRVMWDLYLANATPEEKNIASPMQNKLPHRVPGTYIETAEFDCLHDDGIEYAKKLKAAGADVEIHETKRTIHGYDSTLDSEITRYSMKKRIVALRNAFFS